jgi:hypothetical protein
MSTIEELKTQLTKIRNQITNRKNEANELKLPGKISKVAETHGKYTYWGGGKDHFSEKGLSITVESNYIRVNLGYDTKDVFNAKLLQNDVGEIHLYVPGEWEKRIEELYNEIPEMQRKREISILEKEIHKLKKKWGLGETL